MNDQKTKRSYRIGMYLLLFFCLLTIVAGAFMRGGKEEMKQVDAQGTSIDPKQRLEEVQQEKLQQLEDEAGTYTADTIVLGDTSKEQAEQIAQRIGADVRLTADGSYAVLYLPEGMTISDVYADEENLAWIEEMTPDYYVHTSAVDAHDNNLYPARPNYAVNDTAYGAQGYLDYVNLQDAWNTSRGNGVTIAVIDTGIDTDHPEFEGKISDKSYNASDDKVVADYGMSVIEDEQGHGTAVAGVLAATMNNGVGITGIAPDAELLVIKCDCNENGLFLSSDIVFAIAYAIETDVDVINMSLGGLQNNFSKYTKLAADSDIICVAAAGNDGNALPHYPAADENVIGVGAIDTDKNSGEYELASYSNFGDDSELVAPGTTYTTSIGGGYEYKTGTSLSCPIVAGAVALYLSNNPHTEYFDMCALLEASSTDLGSIGEDWYYGYGALDIHAFLCEEKGTITYDMLTDELENETQVFVKGHNIQKMCEPERDTVVFDGWYYDQECTDECDIYSQIFTENVTLYAGWINEDEGSAYTYATLSDGTIEIRSYTGKRRYLTVPSQIEGKTVTSIGEGAFAGNGKLRTISLPATLTNIGNRAFYNCTALLSMDIPENVAEIGESAFYGCARMNTVTLAKNGALTSIGKQAFASCGITTFMIPAKVASLAVDVFYGSTALRTVTVAEGNSAFKNVDAALYNDSGDTLLYYPAGLTGTYSVPSGTKTVGAYAFAKAKITGVSMPDGLLTMGENCFEGSSLTGLSIPASVMDIGQSAFAYDWSLAEVSFADASQLSNLNNYLFMGCYALSDIQIPAAVKNIGTNVFASSGLERVSFEAGSLLENIGQGVFSYTPLNQIVFPDGVKAIGNYAFDSCYRLSVVDFTRAVKLEEIGSYVFLKCTSLKNVTLPDSLRTIRTQAFFNSGLQSVSIGANLTQIEKGAFSSCQSLSAFEVATENSTYASYDGVLFTKDKTTLLIYPAAKEGTYTLPDETTLIGGYAFAGATKLQNVTFNASLNEIGEYAFSNCSSLATPTFNANLTTIGANAFEYCTAMTANMLIPKKVVSIGRFAFYQDYALTQIRVEAESELSRIGYGAFAYCGIRDFTVPGNVATMGQEVFAGCKNLLAVTFEADSKLTNLAAWTFTGADEIRQITFEEGSGLKKIEARALECLPKLEKVDFSGATALEEVGNYAFNNCAKLSTLTLPVSVSEIGRYAFFGCNALSEVSIPQFVTWIGRYAFAGTNANVYFVASVLPANLEDQWDFGISGYYTGTVGTKTSGEWTYALTQDGKANIVAYSGNSAEITLDKIDGYEIITVGSGVFKDNKTLTNITLPQTLQGIYKEAFYGTDNLVNITIPASVTVIDNAAFQNSGIAAVTFAENSSLQTIGRYAFGNTANLAALQLPKGVEEIRDYTFYNSGIKSLTYADGTKLAQIGRYAFAKSKLESFTAPQTLTKIDYHAFRETDDLTQAELGTSGRLDIYGNAFYQSGLTSVTIPKNVGYLGELCFTACDSLTNITVASENETYASIDGVLFNKAKTKLITCPAGKTGSYEVADTVLSLAFGAFERCKLSEIVFSDNSKLMTLGARTFYDCDSLTTINIPNSVQSVESYAFAYCDNLTTVTTTENSQLSGIYKSAFYNDAKLSAFLIPDGMQEIAEYAFYGCTAMSDVQISENSRLKGIAGHAFEYAGITEFNMPNNLLTVAEYAFHSSKLDTLIFNSQLVSIGEYAFAECGLSKTTIVVIPDTVEWIGSKAFDGCSSLNEVTMPFFGNQVVEEYKDWKLDGSAVSFRKIFGDQSLSTVQKVSVLKGTIIPCGFFSGLNQLKDVKLPNELLKIGGSAFESTGLVEIEIPSQVIEIGPSAFGGCSQLSSIELPNSLKVIEYALFQGCSSLQEVNLPETLEKIEGWAFMYAKLSSITIPKNVRDISDDMVFYACDQLKEILVDEDNAYYVSVDGILYNKAMTKMLYVGKAIEGDIVLPEGLLEIGGAAFSDCVQLKNIKLANSLQKIGEYAFYNCTALEKIEIPENVTELGSSLFENSGIREAVVNCDVDELRWTFWQCKNLQSVYINGNVKSLAHTFGNCQSLEDVQLPDSLTGIGDNVFEYCILSSLYIPKNVAEIASSAFANCGNLQRIIVDEKNPYFKTYDGLLYNNDGTELLFVPSGIEGKLEIPDGVKTLAESVFSSKKQLKEIVVPNSVTYIGKYCFNGCEKLSKITLGSGITYIGRDAFINTAFVRDESNWDTQNDILYIGEYAVDASWSNREGGITEITFKEGTKLLASGLIQSVHFPKLERVYLPDSIEYINDQAFSSLNNLKYVHMSRNAISIGEGCFLGSPLYSISLPETIQFIDDSAFGKTGTKADIKYIHMGKSKDIQIRYNPFVGLDVTTFVLNDLESGSILGSDIENIVIETTNNNPKFNINNFPTANIYCRINEDIKPWPNAKNKIYYAGEWNLATFYVDDMIVKMDPVLTSELVQAPAESLVTEYMPDGAIFKGWDINGDGKVDTLPTTLSEDLEANAVFDVPISSISITGDTEIEVGDTTQLTTFFEPYSYNQSDAVTWSSSDDTIATVTQDGKVTAVSVGAVTMSAVLQANTDAKAEYQIQVIPVQYGIKLSEASGTMNVGETMMIEPRYVLPEGDSDVTTWSSDNETIATVENGEITAHAPGNANIQIKHGDYTATYSLAVKAPIKNVSLVATQGALEVGDTTTLAVSIQPANTTDDTSAIYYSTKASVARVNTKGVVTAVGAGTAVIHALIGDYDVTYTVTVTAPLKWITLNTSTGTLRLERTKQLEVIYEPSNTTDDKSVVWTSDNSEIASVDEHGLVTGNKAGTTVITATVGTFTATYDVTVIGIKDQETGIIVTNSDDTPMAEDISLDVDPMDEEQTRTRHLSAWERFLQFLEDLYKAATGRRGVTSVYDISMLQDNQTVQPEKEVDVEIPVPEDMLTDDAVIYRLEDDGMMTDMHASYVDGRFRFKTSHFSVYVLGAKSEQIYVDEITLTTNSLELCPGKSFEMKYQVAPANVSDAAVVWTSSNEGVAKVNTDGLITAVTEGSVTITATAHDGGGATATCQLEIGHKWNAGEITTPSTCTQEGVRTYTCRNCQATRNEAIAALGHKIVTDGAVAATCTEAGKTEGTHCSVCNEIIKAQTVIPATGHQHTEIRSALEATYTKEGYTGDVYCLDCGKVVTQGSVIPKLTPTTEPTPSAKASTAPTPSAKASTAPTPSAKASTQPTPSAKASTQPTPSAKASTAPTPSAKASIAPTPSAKASTEPTPSAKATVTPAESNEPEQSVTPVPYTTTPPETSTAPSAEPEKQTIYNEDGTVTQRETQTETKSDGTKVETVTDTTEAKDGTVTKKVVETTTNADGTANIKQVNEVTSTDEKGNEVKTITITDEKKDESGQTVEKFEYAADTLSELTQWEVDKVEEVQDAKAAEESDKMDEQQKQAFRANGVQSYEIYDITPMRAGKKVQLAGGKVKVSIYVGTKYAGKRIRVYDLEKNMWLDALLNGEYVTFEAEHFSQYAITAVTTAHLGDTNLDGEVDLQDVQMALRAYLEIENLSEDAAWASDVNKDGTVDLQDVQKILQYYLEIIKEF